MHTVHGDGGAGQSRLGRLYERAYSLLAGRHPRIWPWHFQWHAVRHLHADLGRVLPALSGAVLDVGCGEKPYAAWLGPGATVVGLDVRPGPGVDLVVRSGAPWPVADGAFDAIVCTQVLEHVRSLSDLVHEIDRSLRAGGWVVLSVPFLYHEHGAPDDYWRLSANGARNLLGPGYDVLEIGRQGRVGGLLATLFLAWVEAAGNHSRVTRLVKGLGLPLWLGLSGFVNLVGWLLDRLDRTACFYGNVLLVARKRV